MHTVSPTPDDTLRGILLLVGAMVILPFLDGIAKYLTSYYPTLQVVWGRFFFHLLVMLPFVFFRYGMATVRPQRPALQIVRGGFLLVATICFFAGLRWLPLADALALLFVSPFVVTALSPLILGEHVGTRRWLAVAVGFAGALVIIRPGAGVAHWASVLPMLAGVSFAFYALSTRRLAGSAPPLVTLTFTALFGAICMSAVMPFVWVAVTPMHLLLMLAMGAIAAAGHWLIILAYERTAASVLAPYSYSEIVVATLLGYLWFADFPDRWTWAGIAIIAGSGIYICLRERAVYARRLP